MHQETHQLLQMSQDKHGYSWDDIIHWQQDFLLKHVSSAGQTADLTVLHCLEQDGNKLHT